VSGLAVRPADATHRLVLERLWLMFRHDISEFGRQLPNPDGTFRSERLQAAFCDPDWEAYVIMQDDRPVGFAVVRGLASQVRVLSSFFVVRAVRRTGVGLRAVREVVGRHPGRWEVPFQDNNLAAVRFWRRVATEIGGEARTEERRPVPGQPGLPPDVWISFEVAANR
jgi:predicted acetyltransferase